MSSSVRYVYYTAGHIKVHPPVSAKAEPYTAPFDHVLRLRSPITTNESIQKVTKDLRHTIQAELQRVTDTEHFLAGDPILRSVSLLHTIMVEDNDPSGEDEVEVRGAVVSNYDLHREAITLSDSMTPYHMAKELLLARKEAAQRTAERNRIAELLVKAEEERDALAAHVERLRDFLRSAPLESGVCCCGDNIDNHPAPMSCGHSPMDSGEYAISQILDDTPTTSLARLKAEWMMGEKLRKKQEEVDALAARYAALAGEIRTLIEDSDGVVGWHLNGEVATWSELEVGHLLGEPDEVGKAVIARLKAEWCDEWKTRHIELAEMARESGHMAQADAVEDMAKELSDEAAELRRQAEGGE